MPEQRAPPSGIRRGLRRLLPWSADETRKVPPRPDESRVPLIGEYRPLGAGELDQSTEALVATAQLIRLFGQAQDPEALLQAFAEGLASLHGELRDLGRRLVSAHASGDWSGYGRGLRQLLDKYIRTIDVVDSLADDRTEAEQLRDLLRHALGNTLVILLQRSPKLAREADTLAAALRQWRPGQALLPLEQRLRELTHQVGLRADDAAEQQHLLLGLFDLLLDNVAELLDDRSWLQGQIGVVRQLMAGPLDNEVIEQARVRLREVIYKQGLLKQGIADSKQAMRAMIVSFVERLDGMAASTGQYHERVSCYSQAIGQARSITDLGRLLQDILQDTAQIQAQALGARDDLLSARQQVEDAERRILALERELKDVSGLVREDPLTGALNRRGFDDLFQREAARTRRCGQPLCVALLDLDDFHHTNETHGHAGGDAVLKHLVAVATTVLRTIDGIARFGGEEFVLLLPDATIFETTVTVARLQRALLQRPLVYEDVRVTIAFSAGVAMWREQEHQDDLLKRADRAMYAAKHAGKNRVMSAD